MTRQKARRRTSLSLLAVFLAGCALHPGAPVTIASRSKVSLDQPPLPKAPDAAQLAARVRPPGTNAPRVLRVPTPWNPAWSNSFWQVQASTNLHDWFTVLTNCWGPPVGADFFYTNPAPAIFFRSKVQDRFL